MKLTKSKLKQLIKEELINEFATGSPHAPGLGLAGPSSLGVDLTGDEGLFDSGDDLWVWANKADLKERLKDLIYRILDSPENEFTETDFVKFINDKVEDFTHGRL